MSAPPLKGYWGTDTQWGEDTSEMFLFNNMPKTLRQSTHALLKNVYSQKQQCIYRQYLTKPSVCQVIKMKNKYMANMVSNDLQSLE